MVKHGWWATCAGIAGSFVALPAVLACGDKFLIGSSAQETLRARLALRPGNVAIYADPAEGSINWQASRDSLTKQGHTVTMFDSQAAVLEAVSAGGIDVVLMNVGTARELKSKLEAAGSAQMLPYVPFATQKDVTAAKREFGQALAAPFTSGKLLKAIESTLAALQ